MLIIASCSSQKRVLAEIGLDASASQAIDLNQFAQGWVTIVNQAKTKHPATDVYAGVGLSAAKEAAKCLNAKLQFLSAGMSLVDSTSKIPGYNLTISESGPTPFSKVDTGGTFSDWWTALNNAFGYHEPLYQSVRNNKGLVLIALPANYLRMVQDELLRIASDFGDRVRIITSTKTELHPRLDGLSIRYDQRLNALEGNKGANASFNQRALLNFARLLKNHSAAMKDVSFHRALVNESFKDVASLNPVKRPKASEHQLLNYVKKALAKQPVARTKLLADLRHQNGLACEQSRFYRIYDEVMKMSA